MKRLFSLLAAVFLAACSRVSFTDSPDMPPIFPDYAGVTVPERMAPLRFSMQDGRRFKTQVRQEGDTLYVYVRAWEKGARTGVRYAPFPIYISHDPIDPYIAYRLIVPGYESWNHMGLYTRELASWREHPIVTNDANGKGCLNCHAFPGGNPDRMMFHARGPGGGTVFLEQGEARLLNLATTGLHKQGTYPAWHPGGRYLAFSSNRTQQSFSFSGTHPIEVYDHESDIILMDTQTDSIFSCPALLDPTRMETFPTWSPDGGTLYYCAADSSANVAAGRAGIHYELQAIGFRDGRFEGEPRTILSLEGNSISFPRINGDYLLFTRSAYGTFPIWHREADLWLLNLRTGELRAADELNTEDTESYHSWSSNGRWVIFSSRRMDGRHTRLYLAHFDDEGHFSKPFLLPQKDPAWNTLRLTSFNIPEFVQGDPGRHTRAVSKLFRP